MYYAAALQRSFGILAQFNELIWALQTTVLFLYCSIEKTKKNIHVIRDHTLFHFCIHFQSIIFHQLRCQVRDSVASIKLKNWQIWEIYCCFCYFCCFCKAIASLFECKQKRKYNHKWFGEYCEFSLCMMIFNCAHRAHKTVYEACATNNTVQFSAKRMYNAEWMFGFVMASRFF